MRVADVLTIGACASGSLAALPQVASCCNPEAVMHLKWSSLCLRVISACLWIAYASETDNFYMQIGSSITLLFEITLTGAKVIHAFRHSGPKA